MQRQILVKFTHIEGVHVADDLAAQVGDIQVAKVDVVAAAVQQAAPFQLQLLLGPWVPVGLGCGGWGGWLVSLS